MTNELLLKKKKTQKNPAACAITTHVRVLQEMNSCSECSRVCVSHFILLKTKKLTNTKQKLPTEYLLKLILSITQDCHRLNIWNSIINDRRQSQVQYLKLYCRLHMRSLTQDCHRLNIWHSYHQWQKTVPGSIPETLFSVTHEISYTRLSQVEYLTLVSSMTEDSPRFNTWNFITSSMWDLLPNHGSLLDHVVDLSRVEYVLKLAEESSALLSPALGVDEDQ